MSNTKMSSNTEDTIFLTDKLIYDSSEWKPLTFTHVEYPKGKINLAIQIAARRNERITKHRANFIEFVCAVQTFRLHITTFQYIRLNVSTFAISSARLCFKWFRSVGCANWINSNKIWSIETFHPKNNIPDYHQFLHWMSKF